MTINDLSVLLAAVELAVKRGAYSVLEIGTIGDVSTRLAKFLQDAKAQAEATQSNESDNSEATSAAEVTPDV